METLARVRPFILQTSKVTMKLMEVRVEEIPE